MAFFPSEITRTLHISSTLAKVVLRVAEGSTHKEEEEEGANRGQQLATGYNF
jgi:hypothetical protein